MSILLRHLKAVCMTKIPVAARYLHFEKGSYSRVTDLDLKSSGDLFQWSLNLADHHGKWGFNDIVFRDKWCSDIRPKLLEFEKLTWGELASQAKGRGSGIKHHHVQVSCLTRSAQKRLRKDLLYDDLDDIFSLRLTGKIRLYGIIIERVMNLVWFDPRHEILPMRY